MLFFNLLAYNFYPTINILQAIFLITYFSIFFTIVPLKITILLQNTQNGHLMFFLRATKVVTSNNNFTNTQMSR